MSHMLYKIMYKMLNKQIIQNKYKYLEFDILFTQCETIKYY